MAQLKPELAAKADRVKEILAGLGKVGVSFSNGVDSTLLLHLAVEALGKGNVLALTGCSATLPARELTEARERADRLGVDHLVVETGEVEDPAFRSNPPDRCYHCKKRRLSALGQAAAERGFTHLVEGTNLDDLGDYRPGIRASSEAGARSPFLEAGLTKAEIRELSRELGIAGWDRPAAACLASRLPYGFEVTGARLGQVERGEEFLARLGFSPVRLRHHGEVARLEVAPGQRAEVLLRAEEIQAFFASLGFRYVALDLQGYRTGSLNRSLDHAAPGGGANPAGETGES